MFYPKSPFIKNQLVESQLFSRNHSWLKFFLEWLCKAPVITTYRVNLLTSSVESFKKKLRSALILKYDTEPEIFFIDGIPEVVCISNAKFLSKFPLENHKEIIVDTNCGAALLRGAHIFAPGVLAMESGTKLGETVNVFVDLEGKCRKGTNTVYDSDQKVFIGTGDVKMQRFQLYGENVSNHGIAIEMHSTISGVPSIGDLSSENALLQNLPSIVCIRVLDPQPGEIILDMCSAPGNKTTHIAELTHDSGTLIALDKTEKKVDIVRNKIKAYGLKSVKAFAFDSTKVFNHEGEFQTDCPPFSKNTFDRILLDAPCSALGNRPLLSSNLTPKMMKSYPKVQKKLIENAIGVLKPNGVLVYSTCSVSEDENEGVVKWALDKFPDIKLVEAVPAFGGPGIVGYLTNEESNLVQRFGPQQQNRNQLVDSILYW